LFKTLATVNLIQAWGSSLAADCLSTGCCYFLETKANKWWWWWAHKLCSQSSQGADC